MRFRTGISNVGLLHKIIRSLAALARSCVIKLSEEQVYFIVPGSESATGVQVWSQVKVSTLFEDYRIESNSNNEIWVEVNLDSLVKVLRSADNSVGGINENMRNSAALSQAEVTLKLNKKQNQPIWAFDIKGYTASRKSMIITHEINVKILSSRRQEDLKEPLCPRPDIHVVLPNLQELRNIVSRLAPVADDVDVSANHEGTMELAVRSSKVNLTTTWKDLPIPVTNLEEEGEEAEQPPPPGQMMTTTVTIKALLKFLTSYVISGEAIMCICEGYCVIAYVYIGPIDNAEGVLTFYVPGKATDDN